MQKTLTLSKYIVNDAVVGEVEYKGVLLFPSSFFLFFLFQIHLCLINVKRSLFFFSKFINDINDTCYCHCHIDHNFSISI